MQSIIFASREVKVGKVIGFWPIDPISEISRTFIKNWKDKWATMTEAARLQIMEEKVTLESPIPKDGMSKCEIYCNNCGELQGTLWAIDDSLENWCDFHYVQWNDGEKWYGCLTPNVSPISGQLTLMCCCGNDTRDFRANNTLPIKNIAEIEEINSLGREYGQADSKFVVTPI